MDRLESAPHAGVVTALENDVAVVRFQRSAMCSHCGGCLAIGEKELETRVPNTLAANVGDRVEVSMAGRRVIEASVLAYAVPLAFLLLGIWLGSYLSDVLALLFGVAGCALAFFVLCRMEKRKGFAKKFKPRMTRILPCEPDGEPKIES